MQTCRCSYLFLFLLASTVTADEEVEKANQYIDVLLENLRNDPVIATKIEPIQVPEVYENTFEGRNIYIQGLSDLTRLTDCQIKTEQDKVYVSTILGVDRIKFIMDYKVKGQILPLWVGGKAEGKIDHITVHCIIATSSIDGTGVVEKFKVTHFGDFVVTNVQGTDITWNWVMTYIANIMFNYSKLMVIEGIENGVSKLFQEKLSETKITSRRLKP